jgi:hypothetical protein
MCSLSSIVLLLLLLLMNTACVLSFIDPADYVVAAAVNSKP